MGTDRLAEVRRAWLIWRKCGGRDLAEVFTVDWPVLMDLMCRLTGHSEVVESTWTRVLGRLQADLAAELGEEDAVRLFRWRAIAHIRGLVAGDAGIRGGVASTPGNQEPEQYVTMLQLTPILSTSKSNLEKILSKSPDAPLPCIEGGGGKAHQWRWSVLRPYLERRFGRILPERFPSIER